MRPGTARAIEDRDMGRVARGIRDLDDAILIRLARAGALPVEEVLRSEATGSGELGPALDVRLGDGPTR